MNNIEKFKKGVALMSTRPFGEKFIEQLLINKYGYKRSGHKNYDLINPKDGSRVEVKATRLFTKPDKKETLINQILQSADKKFESEKNFSTVNFQKIHPDQFDSLILVIVLDEGINITYFSDRDLKLSNQHLNNKEMKQISFTSENFKKCPKWIISWEEAYEKINI